MADTKQLTSALLGSVFGKRANSMVDDYVAPSPKLQAIVGEPEDGPSSTFAQFRPGSPATVAEQLSPVQGDADFWVGMNPGARFMDKEGSWWEIEDYDFEGRAAIRNVWYPDLNPNVSIQDIRRSIHSWVHPRQIIVPPAPAGIDYAVLETKSVN